MGATTFSGPVVSTNGFTGDVTGNVTGNVTAPALTISGTNFTFANAPTSDPSVTGQVWSNGGVLTVSAG